VGLGVYVVFLVSGKKSTRDKARADARARGGEGGGYPPELQEGGREHPEGGRPPGQGPSAAGQDRFREGDAGPEERLSQLEKRLLQKEDQLDRKTRQVRGAYGRVRGKGTGGSRRRPGSSRRVQADLDARLAATRAELERVAGLSGRTGQRKIVEVIAEEAKMEAGKKIRVMDEEFKEAATQKPGR